MKKYSEKTPDWEDQRKKIIGLGESSIRKSYYPELQQRLHELEQTNAELLDAIEEIRQKEEELRQNYDELNNIQSALDLAKKEIKSFKLPHSPGYSKLTFLFTRVFDPCYGYNI